MNLCKFRRKNNGLIAAAKEAKNNGVNVIGVTSKYNSDLSKYTDIMHTVVSSTLYEKNKIFISSLLPLIDFLHNLLK
ncbi:SIS domain-containing protein [Spiroplasma sp. ald]|uniref:SIS domain-containing protein n=1 Tax=Spiroplasma sp. ald TaxID=2490849 RepID=UPI0037DCC424